MTVYFANTTPLDLVALTTMGVSVKVTGSPIGFFGTGLKFAIATLLRTGHRVRLWIQDHEHILEVRPTTIRGEVFQVVHLDGERLGYTTALGKNWEPWQAYRELASNAMDEDEHLISDKPVSPTMWDTLIEVTGDGIDSAWRERHDIFCTSRVVHSLANVGEMREGRTRSVYYRGVRVHTLQKHADYTWNILEAQDLTEDRTLRWPHVIPGVIGRVTASVEDVDVAASVIMADDSSYESSASFSWSHTASPAFLQAAKLTATNVGANLSAIRLWEALAPNQEVYINVELDKIEVEMVREAHALCEIVDPDYTWSDPCPRFVEDLGVGILGQVRGGEILIARGCLTMGVDMLAGTFYEEWLHLHRGYHDESRSMQNHLLNQLVRLSRRLPCD